jgi:hypothetical protein
MNDRLVLTFSHKLQYAVVLMMMPNETRDPGSAGNHCLVNGVDLVWCEATRPLTVATKCTPEICKCQSYM